MTGLHRRGVVAGALALPFIVQRRAWAADPIRIAVINPFSGPLALYGDEATRGYDLGADEINAAGGLLGRKIEMLRGDAISARQAITATDEMATRSNVDAFVGCYISAVAGAGSDNAARYNKLWWETNALASDLTTRGLPNFIRAGQDAKAFADTSIVGLRDVIAPALGKNFKDLVIWIEHEDSDYGSSIAREQKKLLDADGVTHVTVSAHSAGSIDLSDSILRAKRATPDVYLVTSYTPTTNLLLRTAKGQNFVPPAIISVGSGDSNETKNAVDPEFLERVVIVGYPRWDMKPSYAPGADAFLAAYRAKYKKDPLIPQTLTAYVGMQFLARVVAKANTFDIDKVRAAAATFDLPMGSAANGFGLKFDDTMQNTRALPTLVQWQGGKLVTIYPGAAAEGGSKVRNIGTH